MVRHLSQYIQPYEFGHAENVEKRTGLWLKGLPKLKGTKFIDVKGLPNKERHRLIGYHHQKIDGRLDQQP